MDRARSCKHFLSLLPKSEFYVVGLTRETRERDISLAAVTIQVDLHPIMSQKTRSQAKALVELNIAKRGNPASNKATSSPFPFVVELPSESAKILDVKRAILGKLTSLGIERQRLTTEDKRVVNDDRSLTEEGLKTGDTLYLKDLGPQIAWRTVFLTEYAGPLFIQPLIYYVAPSIWPGGFTYSRMQKCVLQPPSCLR